MIFCFTQVPLYCLYLSKQEHISRPGRLLMCIHQEEGELPLAIQRQAAVILVGQALAADVRGAESYLYSASRDRTLRGTGEEAGG